MRPSRLSWSWSLAMALGLTAAALRAGALDPKPDGAVFCLLDEAFVPNSRSQFIAGLSTGDFVLGYTRESSTRTLASIFDAEGQGVGPEIELDEPFVGEQSRLDVVTSSPDGDWLATWTGHGSPGTDDDLTSVKARLLDASGTPLGDSFQVNTFEYEVQSTSDAVFLAAGGFVVVFESDAFEILVNDVRARLFSANGQPLGNDFIVTETVEGFLPEVVALSDGGFVVLYAALSADNDPLGLAVRHYDTSGTLENEGLVPVFENPEELITSIVAEADPVNDTLHVALVVSQNEGDLDRGIIRLVNLKRVGDEFIETSTFDIVSEGVFSVNWYPSLLIGPMGLKTLVWDRNPTGIGDEFDVLARTFSSSNEPASATAQIDEDLLQIRAGAALVGEGRGIAAWRTTEGPCNMQGRFMTMPQPLFIDGFESGDTSAWSATVP